MRRLSALGLLLACAASLGSCAVIVENGMPIMWAQTAAHVADLPTQNGVLTPDAWNFLTRMSFYRLMIAATHPFMGSMGPNSTDSPMWGLPLQLGWMLTSKRLADPTGATTCGLQTGNPMCISPQSWWGCFHYYVSVLPFLSAAQQGFMGPGVKVQMEVPAGTTEYCANYADCAARYPDVMDKWDAFFKGLKTAVESSQPDNEKKDTILGLYWAAQMASTYATEACKAKQSQYSSAEVSFISSWLNSAEYVSAAHFQSSLPKSAVFMKPLPSRILQDGDEAPNIADLPEEENQTLSTFSWMNTMNGLLGGSLVRMWRNTMCSVTTREKGREMLEQLLLNPADTPSTFMAIITGMGTSC